MVQSVIKKMLETAAATKDFRPSLKCIHYFNGGVVATDAHRLLRFNDINSNLKFEATIDASSFLPYNDKYPEVDNLIPLIDDSHVELRLDKIVAEQLAKFLKMNGQNIVDFNISDKDKVNVSNDLSGKFDISLGDSSYRKSDLFDGKPVSLNASYLYEALRYLNKLDKDLNSILDGRSVKEKYDNDVVITFYGQLRPFLVTFLNMQYLITPVRKYDDN